MERDREFDIVLWGATGFTGRLVAEYLLRQYGPPGEGSRSNLRWALGGRSEDKLKALIADLGSGGEQIPLVLADSDDRALLDVMAARSGRGRRKSLEKNSSACPLRIAIPW